MDMPSLDTYNKMYGLGPFAARMQEEQIGMAKMFQQGRQQKQAADLEATTLDNLYNQQTLGDRVSNQRALSQQNQTKAQSDALEFGMKEALQPFKLDAEQKKLVMQAKESELKEMELGAQELAYSSNPQEREAGLQLMRMHKEFVKLREQAGIDAQKAATQHGYNVSMENLRNKNLTERGERLAKIKADAGAARANNKMTSDQYRAFLLQQANQARANGDNEAAAMLYQEAQYVTDLRASERPDPNVNKVDIGGVAGVPTVPPRPTPQPPGIGAQPRPVPQGLPAGAKQIGTSGGRPVYEINGKRFMLSE